MGNHVNTWTTRTGREVGSDSRAPTTWWPALQASVPQRSTVRTQFWLLPLTAPTTALHSRAVPSSQAIYFPEPLSRRKVEVARGLDVRNKVTDMKHLGQRLAYGNVQYIVGTLLGSQTQS